MKYSSVNSWIAAIIVSFILLRYIMICFFYEHVAWQILPVGFYIVIFFITPCFNAETYTLLNMPEWGGVPLVLILRLIVGQPPHYYTIEKTFTMANDYIIYTKHAWVYTWYIICSILITAGFMAGTYNLNKYIKKDNQKLHIIIVLRYLSNILWFVFQLIFLFSKDFAFSSLSTVFSCALECYFTLTSTVFIVKRFYKDPETRSAIRLEEATPSLRRY